MYLLVFLSKILEFQTNSNFKWHRQNNSSLRMCVIPPFPLERHCCQTCSFYFIFLGALLFGSSLLLSATLNRSCLPHRIAFVCDINCCSCLQHIKLLWTLVRDIKSFLFSTSNRSCPDIKVCLVRNFKGRSSLQYHIREIKLRPSPRHQIPLVSDIKSRACLQYQKLLMSAISHYGTLVRFFKYQIALVHEIKLRSCPRNQTSLVSATSNHSSPRHQKSLLSSISNRCCLQYQITLVSDFKCCSCLQNQTSLCPQHQISLVWTSNHSCPRHQTSLLSAASVRNCEH
jgi:hypothetical protein